jgi:hypothetical protein
LFGEPTTIVIIGSNRLRTLPSLSILFENNRHHSIPLRSRRDSSIMSSEESILVIDVRPAHKIFIGNGSLLGDGKGQTERRLLTASARVSAVSAVCQTVGEGKSMARSITHSSFHETFSVSAPSTGESRSTGDNV